MRLQDCLPRFERKTTCGRSRLELRDLVSLQAAVMMEREVVA